MPRRRNRRGASRGKSRVSLSRDQNPLGMFPLPGGPFRVPCRRFPPEIGAREPVSLAAPKRFALQRSSVAGSVTLRSSSVGREPRPLGSNPRRPSSSAVTANEVWSPGDRLSLVSPSGRPDRGPGGHSHDPVSQGPVRLLHLSRFSGLAFTPFQSSGRDFALPEFSQTFRSASPLSAFASSRDARFPGQRR